MKAQLVADDKLGDERGTCLRILCCGGHVYYERIK
jgi:hypothetical protein